MTDTTDIKALRDAIRYCSIAKEMYGTEFQGAKFKLMKVATPELLSSILDQFEAERQRADEAVKERRESIAARRKSSTQWREQFDAVHLRARKAEAELAELKGEQVPVAWLNDAHLARGHIEGEAGEEDAGPGMIPVYRERFSAPQKPVVLPKSHYICGCADRYMSEKEVKAAIEAAGGIVKDGK